MSTKQNVFFFSKTRGLIELNQYLVVYLVVYLYLSRQILLYLHNLTIYADITVICI